MKNSKLLFLIPLLVFAPLTGCQKGRNDPVYHDDILYDGPTYEPINFAREDAVPYSISVLGFPKEGLKQTCWDVYESIKFRVYYQTDDYTPLLLDYPFYEKNIPLEFRHYLGEIGTHKINIQYGLMPLEFEFTVIENPDWHGFKCEYFDKDGKYITTEQVDYFAVPSYHGPELVDEEDDVYKYHFVRWNNNAKYVYQDMQFKAVYQKEEKRLVALKPRLTGYDPLGGLISSENPNKGQALIYLGRVKRATLSYGDTKELDMEDIDISFNYGDYSRYWNDLNNSVIAKMRYRHDANYDDCLFGSLANILNHPDFASGFDDRFKIAETQAVLENNERVTLSHAEPYDTCISLVNSFNNHQEKITKENYVSGFYRLAVVASVDVYLSISINRLERGVYEVGDFNYFLISPIYSSAAYAIQYCEDNNFAPFDDSYLELSNKAVYETARIIGWK